MNWIRLQPLINRYSFIVSTRITGYSCFNPFNLLVLHILLSIGYNERQNRREKKTHVNRGIVNYHVKHSQVASKRIFDVPADWWCIWKKSMFVCIVFGMAGWVAGCKLKMQVLRPQWSANNFLSYCEKDKIIRNC